MILDIKTFNLGTGEEKARKVCEEATEFYAEHANLVWQRINGYGPFATSTDGTIEDIWARDLMLEIGDVFTALANYCAYMGINAQDCIYLAQIKNLARGRYGNPSEVALKWSCDAQEDTSSE